MIKATMLATKSKPKSMVKKAGILFSIDVKETYFSPQSFSLMTFHSVLYILAGRLFSTIRARK